MESCETITLTLPAHNKYAPVLGTVLQAMLDERTDEAYNIQLAVHEAFTNIVDHAGGEGVQQPTIALSLSLDEATGLFTAVLQDNAPPFSPSQVGWAEPEAHWETAVWANTTQYTLKTTPEPDLLQIRGRGLFLMNQLMSSVTCQVSDTGNRWTLTRALLLS